MRACSLFMTAYCDYTIHQDDNKHLHEGQDGPPVAAATAMISTDDLCTYMRVESVYI
jgi:hypothetical protein